MSRCPARLPHRRALKTSWKVLVVKQQEARKEVPVNKQLVRSESQTQNNKPTTAIWSAFMGDATLQALGARTPVLGGHGPRKAAEDWHGSGTRHHAPAPAAGAARTWAASAGAAPAPASPLQP